MKNKTIGLMLVLSAFLISGCGKSNGNSSNASSGSTSESESSGGGSSNKVTAKMAPNLNSSRTSKYEIEFEYDDSYFLATSKQYSKYLSLLSFGLTLAASDVDNANGFFGGAEFKDVTPKNYDITPTEDTVGYIFAHKEIENYEVFAVTVRGFDYGKEWGNNFKIGKEGDHEGFAARADEIYEDLASYVNLHKGNKSVKLWISGYSRGGGISNVLASYIMLGEAIAVEDKDTFVYTYEAPNCLTVEHAVAYENVHNIVNRSDLIASIPPESHELKRCGIDHDIYDSEVSSIVKTFDSGIEIPEFKSVVDTKDDKEFLDYLLSTVFKSDMADDISAYTREQYTDNYQDGLTYSIGLIFGLKESTRSQLLADMMNLGYGAMSLINDQTGVALADFIKTYLDTDGIEYVYDDLVANCAILVKAVGNLFVTILMGAFLLDDFKSNLMRLIDMHFIETVYSLLLNSFEA